MLGARPHTHPSRTHTNMAHALASLAVEEVALEGRAGACEGEREKEEGRSLPFG